MRALPDQVSCPGNQQRNKIILEGYIMQLAGKIKDLSEKYRSYTAEVLGKMIRVPGFSGKEKDRC